jgi:DNA-binding MarR family transcriptional regulator
MPTIQKTLQILEFIRRCVQSNNEAPTLKEIARHFHLSIASAHQHLKKMEVKGWIRRSRRWRGIEIVTERKAA